MEKTDINSEGGRGIDIVLLFSNSFINMCNLQRWENHKREQKRFNPLPLLQLSGEPSVCSHNKPRMKVLSRSKKKACVKNPAI